MIISYKLISSHGFDIKLIIDNLNKPLSYETSIASFHRDHKKQIDNLTFEFIEKNYVRIYEYHGWSRDKRTMLEASNLEVDLNPLTDTGENEPKCRVNYRLGAESYSSLGRGGNSSGHFGTCSPVDKF